MARLLTFPMELLRSALFGELPLHEWCPTMRNIRATNRLLHELCCMLAVEVYDAVEARAKLALKSFPNWSASQPPLAIIPMEEWVTDYMRELISSTKHMMQITLTAYDADHGTTHESQFMNRPMVLTANNADSPGNDLRRQWVRDVNFIMAALGLSEHAGDVGHYPSTLDHHWEQHQELCYRLCSRANTSLRLEGLMTNAEGTSSRRMVHVPLASLADWFRAHGGWQLDACASMLFGLACARKMDAGSSWMVNGYHADALEGQAHLCDVQSFVLERIATGREADLLVAMRQRFNAEWTSMAHSKLFRCIGDQGCTLGLRGRACNGAPRSSPRMILGAFSYLCMREERRSHDGRIRESIHCASADFKALRDRLLQEVQTQAVQADTVAVVERKLNACLPMTKLLKNGPAWMA